MPAPRKLAALAALLALVPLHSHADEAALNSGKEKAAVCAACHGVDGNSNSPEWPSLAGQHREYLHRQLQHFKDGRRINEQMSAMVVNLSDEDMAEISYWYSSQALKPAIPESARAAQLGEKIYRVGNPASGVPACIGCHGPTGRGNPLSNYPALAGQHSKYTEGQLRLFHNGGRDNDDNAVMRTIAGKMTNFEIRAVSEYIAGLR